jgi:hypothetical protein
MTNMKTKTTTKTRGTKTKMSMKARAKIGKKATGAADAEGEVYLVVEVVARGVDLQTWIQKNKGV